MELGSLLLAKSANLGSRRVRKRQIGASSTWLNSLNWVQRVANFSRLPVRTAADFNPRGVCVDRVSEPRNSDGGTCRVSPWCPLPAPAISRSHPARNSRGPVRAEHAKTRSKGPSLPGPGPQLSEPSRSNRTQCNVCPSLVPPALPPSIFLCLQSRVSSHEAEKRHWKPQG